MRRHTIFAHYDPENFLQKYVIVYLSALRAMGEVTFVTTSDISEDDMDRIRQLGVRIVRRPNIGYDFMSWQTGLYLSELHPDIDELIICNDSCYAPLFPFAEVFGRMSRKDIEFWGLTSNNEISRHIQSYFMVFRRPVWQSQTFWDFWCSVMPQRTKELVVQQYEIGLTKTLQSAGFRWDTAFDQETTFEELFFVRKITDISAMKMLDINGQRLSANALLSAAGNPSLTMWPILLNARIPTLKVSLTKNTSLRETIVRRVAALSDYNAALMYRNDSKGH